MPDYSACINKSCAKKNDCARYRMVFSKYQSVGGFGGKDCDAFWDIRKGGIPFKLKPAEEPEIS